MVLSGRVVQNVALVVPDDERAWRRIGREAPPKSAHVERRRAADQAGAGDKGCYLLSYLAYLRGGFYSPPSQQRGAG